MSKKRNKKLCKCQNCFEDGKGKLVLYSTYQSHKARQPFLRQSKQPLRIRLIVRPLSIERRTTFTLTAEQQLYVQSVEAGPSRAADGASRVGPSEEDQMMRPGDDADAYDFLDDSSDYGDLYVNPMDLDLLRAASVSPELEELPLSENSGSEGFTRPPQEADSCDSDDWDSDRDKPFRFDVPDPPAPARELFTFLPAKSFWKPFLLGVAYVNLRFHVTHRACNLILNIAKIVFTHLNIRTEELDRAERLLKEYLEGYLTVN